MSMHLAGNVELDAVAGREQNEFGTGKLFAKRSQRPPGLLGTERHLLAHLKRRGGVVESQEQKALHSLESPGSQSPGARMNFYWLLASGSWLGPFISPSPVEL